MRVSTEELLSIRDGEPVDVTAMQRLAAEPAAQAELRRLQACRKALQRLPELEPPAGVWERIVATHRRERFRPTRPSLPVLGGAVSAVAVIAVVIWASLLPRPPEAPAPDAAERFAVPAPLAAPVTASADAAGEVMSPSGAGWRLATLQHRSYELERLLRDSGYRPRLASALTAGTAAQLEDRLLAVDHRLSSAAAAGYSDEQLAELWEQRVELMNSLLAVRQAQAQRHAF